LLVRRPAEKSGKQGISFDAAHRGEVDGAESFPVTALALALAGVVDPTTSTRSEGRVVSQARDVENIANPLVLPCVGARTNSKRCCQKATRNGPHEPSL
jgi:hypothetical protein